MFLILATILFAVTPMISKAETSIQKGQYIFQLANCYSCHTDTEHDGKTAAGGRAMETVFGTFYPPNITPDEETGIGLWTEQEFALAVRSGLAPDGSHYYPSFPYNSYKNITDADLKALKAYIFSLKPVKQENKTHELKWYVSRLTLPIWKSLNSFLQNDTASNPTRGAYLIDTLGHCHECHTPRNRFGMLQMDKKFSGNKELSAPDISTTSAKDWNEDLLVELFTYGELPDGDYVSDHMAEVVEFSTSKWKPEDLKAAIHYLRSH